MAQTWRPEKIDEFVGALAETEGRIVLAFTSIMDETSEDVDIEGVPNNALVGMERQWRELSPWERLNAFLRIRGLVEGLTKKTFEQLNAEARAADAAEER